MGGSPITMRVLGGFRLTSDRGEVVLQKACQRLLGLLALQGEMSRAGAAAALWPDSGEERAGAALRTAVWRVDTGVRPLRSPVVHAMGAGLLLDPGVVVDLHVLRGLLHGERTADLLGVGALSSRSCELLPDWDEEWVVLERERVHQMRLHLLERLAVQLLSAGQHGAALDAALACVAIDPLRESAHRTVIAIHLEEGNLAEARHASARCVSVLTENLGVGPSEETMALLPHEGQDLDGVALGGASRWHEGRPRSPGRGVAPCG